MSSPDYDAIVVGGGHNGLTAAAYLAPLAHAVGEHLGEHRPPADLEPPERVPHDIGVHGLAPRGRVLIRRTWPRAWWP